MPTHRYFLPDFIEIQRESFLNFLKKGILEEFSKKNPITNNNKNIEIFFYSEYFCLTKPKYSIQQAIFFKKSYVSKLYVPIQYTDKKKKLIFLKWILIAQLPLMTKRGHFILNGAARVIINQLVRSPGVYFRENFYEIYLNKWASKPSRILQRFYADIICLKGTWVRIEIDKDFCMWVRLKKGPKIPLLWFLLGMGLNEKMIFQSVISPNFLLKSFHKQKEKTNQNSLNHKQKEKTNSNSLKYPYVSSTPEAWKSIEKLLNLKKTYTLRLRASASFASGANHAMPEAGRACFESLTLKTEGTKLAKQREAEGYRKKKNLNNLSFQNFNSVTGNFSSYKIYKMYNKNISRSINSLQNQHNYSSVCHASYASFVPSVLRVKLSKQALPASGMARDAKLFDSHQNKPFASDSGAAGLLRKKKQSQGMAGINKKLSSVDSANLGRKWFFQRFMNPKTYDLGKKGRLALNEKLGLTILPNQTTLTAQDLLFITDYLMKVEKGIYPVDDIDHLKNKRIRSAGEFIQMQFAIGLMRLEKTLIFKLNTKSKKTQIDFIDSPKDLIISKYFDNGIAPPIGKKQTVGLVLMPKASLAMPEAGRACFGALRAGGKARKARQRSIGGGLTLKTEGAKKQKEQEQGKGSQAGNLSADQATNHEKTFIWLNSVIQAKFVNGALKEFFGTHPLSQFMDQINPLAEITHKRRLTSLGPGGVARDTATLAIRGIHPSHYGRICPIETPEGKNTGLVNSLTVYARVNEEGFILTPFFSMYVAQIQKSLGKVYLSAAQEEKFQIATPDLNITNKNFLPKQKIPVRSGKNFLNDSAESVSFIGVSALQMISVATSLIPFLEHDDANRALMGSNMQRQAVPLIKPERPFIGTGLEAKAISDSGHALTTSQSGFVLYASASEIILYTMNE